VLNVFAAVGLRCLFDNNFFRYARLRTEVDPAVVDDEDSDAEEWDENVKTVCVTSGMKEFYQQRSTSRTHYSSRSERLSLSTSLDVDFFLPYAQPIRGVHLLDPRDEPRAESLARDYGAISGIIVVVADDKAQKMRTEKAYYKYYGQSDKTLGQFLVDNCFQLRSVKDKPTYLDHSWNFVHRDGRVEIEVTIKDGERGSAGPLDEEDLMQNTGSVPIFNSSYCNVCSNWVTPLEIISDETWKLSLGKFLEIFLYNKSAVCRTGECSHTIRDNHSQSFFCDTPEGRFQARVQFHPIHPFSLRVRSNMTFNANFHNSESISYLRHFLTEIMDTLGDFRRIISVLEKEVSEIGITEENEKDLVHEISSLMRDVNIEQAEVEASVHSVITELSTRTASQASDEHTELNISIRYPAIFYRNFVMKAMEWNRSVDHCHRYLSQLSKSHVQGPVPNALSATNEVNKANIVDSGVLPDDPSSTHIPAFLQDVEALTVSIADVHQAARQPDDVASEVTSTVDEVRMRGNSVSGPSRLERRVSASTIFKPGSRIARALSNFGFLNPADLMLDRFNVPLDDYISCRFHLEPGRDGEVIAVHEDIIASIISYSIASKEYWSKLKNETEDNDDGYDIKNEEIHDAEHIPDMEVPHTSKDHEFGRFQSFIAEEDASVLNPTAFDAFEHHSPVPLVIGIAKVILKPEDPIKVCSIEEKEEPLTGSKSFYINQMKSSKKLHIKHRFEEKNEDDIVSCKFIVQTFWALQFHALRTCFLNDETDEGYIRSLAQSASWNAQVMLKRIPS